MVITVLCFGLIKACEENTVVFRNRLGAGRILKVDCLSNRTDRKIGYVNFNEIPYRINFHEAVFDRTTWNCLLRDGNKLLHFRAYLGNVFPPRCGDLRVYIAKPNGIYLSKNADPEKFNNPWKL